MEEDVHVDLLRQTSHMKVALEASLVAITIVGPSDLMTLQLIEAGHNSKEHTVMHSVVQPKVARTPISRRLTRTNVCHKICNNGSPLGATFFN
jgi:hypothetical protein